MAELFDAYGRSYRSVVQSSIDFSGLPHSFFMTAKADMLRDLIATRLDGMHKLHLLDVGCGVGALHPFLRGMFDRLTGIDVSAASIAQARRSNPEVEYNVYDGESLPYGNATFDLAAAICVMHHVAPRRWLDFLREMRRVVRRGGIVCVFEHNPFNPLTRLAVARCEFDRDAVLLRAGRMQALMANAGLADIESRYFLMLPWTGRLTWRIEQRFRRVPLGAQYVTCGGA
jgi:ubiquinone/menaquinone biosynthesis C-methylase UbiE